MSKLTPYFAFALVAACAISAATLLQPIAQSWDRKGDSDSLIHNVLGDGKRLFANHFFTKADISFHSGYYPTIFDQTPAKKSTAHLTGEDEHDHHDQDHDHDGHDDHGHEAGHAEGKNAISSAHAEHDGHEENDHATQHEKDMAFMGKPKDWIEAFGRNFLVTEETHLTGGTEREMLPWLRIAAELNPESPETYTVTSYWLRRNKRFKEAEDFLRRGIKYCPNSYELYFELGDVFYTEHKDTDRARNLWVAALQKWRKASHEGKENEAKVLLDRIALNLAKLEEGVSNYTRAIEYLQIAREASPNPEAVDARIAEMRAKANP